MVSGVDLRQTSIDRRAFDAGLPCPECGPAERRLHLLGFVGDRRHELRAAPARTLMHLAQVWRWRRRWGCHRSVWCCQYMDRPNCNNANAPRGRHHR